MTNLRDEIDRRLTSNQVYYAHFVTEQDFPRIRKETTDDILKLFEKRIDERIGQLSFFEENMNNDEYKFNVKKQDRQIAQAAIQSKRLAFQEVKEMLKE